MARPTKYPEWADGGSALLTEPTSAKKLLGWLKSEKPLGQFFNWWMNLVFQWIVYNDTRSGSLFSDGSDGAGVADGVGALPGATMVGPAYTLQRDVFFTNLTVSLGVLVDTNGFRIMCSGTLTNNGTIRGDGHVSVGQPAGSASPAETVGGGTAGGAGGNFGAGSIGNPGTISIGGSGGAGAAGTAAGAAGGTATPPVATAGGFRQLWNILYGVIIGGASPALLTGGCGGGGGGGNTTSQPGGGGGGGGRIVVIAAPTIVNTGTISANGGAGGSSSNPNTGTGGGGGGGAVLMAYASLNNTGTISANGGPGGAAFGGAAAGTAGSAGTVIQLQL